MGEEKITKKMEKIWFGVVGVKSLKGNEIIPYAKGAHVNIACIADDEENFKKIAQENFHYHKLKVYEIHDIETEDTLTIDNPDNAEKLQLGDTSNGVICCRCSHRTNPA